MKCSRCGKETPNNIRNCIHCGYVFQQSESIQIPNKETPKSVNVDKYLQRKKENNERNKKQTLIALVIAVALVIAIVITSIVLIINNDKLFPLTVTVDSGNQELSTYDGTFENLEFQITSNRPIRYISYALNPESLKGKDGFQRVKTGNKLFNRTLNITHLEVPFGENSLYVRVTTLFGKKDCEIVLTRDIGYTSAPDDEAIVTVSLDAELISNELVVVFKEDATIDDIKKLVSDYEAEIVGENYLLGEYQIRFSGTGEEYIDSIMEELKKETIVEDVFFNMVYLTKSEFNPNDNKFDSWDTNKPSGNNWGLEAINAPGAWDYVNKISTVHIGVIDSSLQYNHSDLQIDPNKIHVLPTNDFKTIDDIENYYDKYANSHQCRDDYCVFCSMKDHGTHCTGIIGALGNNGTGVAGVSWNAEMYFTTAWYLETDGEGQMKNYDTTGGFMYDITWLAANGCRVMSMSIGSSNPTDPNNIDEYEISDTKHYDRTFRKLQDAGYDFLLCKAAGNENDDARNYRLNRVFMNAENAREHVIIVAAAKNTSTIVDRLAAWLSDTDKIYNLANYSNYGSMIDIAAPGSNIFSTIYGNTYKNMSGTSMATPMVAGVAGLVFGANPNLSSDSVKRILCFTGNNYCEKNLEVYNMLDAKEAVEWALNNGQNLPEREKPSLGFVTGMIQDAETLDLVEDAVVSITDEENGKTFGAAVYEGTYEICLPPGTYTMEFAAYGYLTEKVYHVEVTAEVVNYNILLNMVTDSTEQGIVSGRVINAFDGNSIPDASINIYRGVNNTSGTPIIETQSDSSGYYSVSLDPGNYTVFCSARGYMDGKANVISISGKDNTDQDCTLTPILNDGEMRIVLTWGRYPADLDSHLVGPAPDGSFHTYYQNMNYSHGDILYDNLDVDDTTSYGPETTSVYVGESGTYTFYVHNYTDRDSSTSSTMSTSSAQVKLYVAGQSEPIVYNVPNKAGTVWKVFSITDGNITPINKMSYENNPSDVGE